MKLITFAEEGRSARPGLLAGEQVIDLAGEGFADSLAFLAAPLSVQLDVARKRGSIPRPEVKLLAPVPSPPRVFGIGLNYAEHAAETKAKLRTVPTVFIKLSSSVVGPDAKVVLPRISSQVDYEAELGVVIGQPGYRISAAQAEEHIFGYTIVNDVSARDVQHATTQWNLAKSFPTFTPMGPWVVSKDEVGDAHSLNISMTISGDVLQNSNTNQLIFKIPQLIEFISAITPLESGDVISTGTPSGVGIARSPQRWLREGDEMTVRIEGIGELRNVVAAE